MHSKTPDGTWNRWLARKRRQHADRALVRQLTYQEGKARVLRGRQQEVMTAMMRRSAKVRATVEGVRPIARDTPVLEVGSGAHGLIFFFGSRGVGIDPLAHQYRSFFPAWQKTVPTLAAGGEALPFGDGSFDVVLSDNVVDHAEDPAGIVAEMARVLAPSGVLYFTVNIHHPIYTLVSSLHATWRALGVPYEIGPFADHTTHLTVVAARRLFENLPLRIIRETTDVENAKATARQEQPRHLGDRLKRVFFKNALFEVIAVREP